MSFQFSQTEPWWTIVFTSKQHVLKGWVMVLIVHMFGETYSLQLITKYLKSENIPFKYSNAGVGFGICNHGCRVIFNDTYNLSIQTHPDVTGSSFAETALQNQTTKQIMYDGTFGYHDVKRWNTPDDLFEHIKQLRTAVPLSPSIQTSVRVNS